MTGFCKVSGSIAEKATKTGKFFMMWCISYFAVGKKRTQLPMIFLIYLLK